MKILSVIMIVALFVPSITARELPAFEIYFKQKGAGEVQARRLGRFQVQWIDPRDEILVDPLLTHMQEADKALSPIFKDRNDAKLVPIEIYPDLPHFSAVSGLSLSRFRATGTIALTLDQRLMILSPRNLATGYSWLSTVTHEYVHYLIREISPDLIPIWLHEGVAQVFQDLPYDKARLKPAQWGLFSKAKREKKWLSLQTLREPFPYRKDPEETELAYIEALLLSQWLDQKCGVVSLIRWTEESKSLEKALEKCAGMPLDELEKKFFPEILAKVSIPQGPEIQYYARDFSGSDPLETEGRRLDKESRNFAQLASELFNQGRFRASAHEMEIALSKVPVAPPSWRRQLALSFQKMSQSERATETLKKILNDYPEDAASWYLLAQVHKNATPPERLWQYYLRAFFINPFMDGLLEEMAHVRSANPSFPYSLLPIDQQK